uniref:E3 ubiquitin-protein ligase RNF220 middle domain-containing protein n=1 Tax=Timema douglasi TaxID=61478 RepID=A0A7R8VGX6_TIMDO|nr:unnamed protein product [Timema douglasi]
MPVSVAAGVNASLSQYTRLSDAKEIGAGMAACGTSSSRRPSPVDEDVDLVVDGDDSATYGPSQYSEQDVIVMSADGGPHEDKEREALREAVISPEVPPSPPYIASPVG